jgi:hypothetical protein
MRAEVRIVVAQVRGEAVNADIFLSVGPSDCDELPAFIGQDKRFFEGARAGIRQVSSGNLSRFARFEFRAIGLV